MSAIAALLAALARVGGVLVKVLPLLGAYWAGRKAQQANGLESIVEIQDEQLRKAAMRPRDRRELVERLRRDGL